MPLDAPLDEPPRSIRLVRLAVPLATAHLTAHGAERVRDVVLVGWTTADGVEGWGECPTLSAAGYATETTEVAWRALVDHLAPAALGRRSAVDAAPLGLLAAPAALADARLDARLRGSGRSLREHLGGTRPTLARTVVIAELGGSPADLAERARVAVAGGAELVKVKIAPGHDVEVLAAVIEATPGSASGGAAAAAVAADANGSYADPAELAAVDHLGLRYLEQPFSPDLSLDRLAALHERLDTPVALDESLVSVDVVRHALDAGAARVVSVKPARLGGVAAAALAVSAAASAGVDAFVGGMLELGIGRAGAAAVATLSGCTLPTDLGPSQQYVATDICRPVVVDARGRLVPPDGAGIGRTPDDELLERFAVDQVVL